VREHLLDALAIAGGPLVDPNEAEVRLVRGKLAVSARLGEIHGEDLATSPCCRATGWT
jgi:hypothetical protein